MSETKQDKWDRGRTLMLESLHKPDDRLRGCAHNQECYHELLEIRDEVVEIVRSMKNPHTAPLKAGDKNSNPPVHSINGISVVVLGGALGPNYMKDWTEEQVAEYEEWKAANPLEL